MRDIYITLSVLSVTLSLFFSQSTDAQTPGSMSYQAVIRNSSNQLVTNTQIGMQISILQGSASGSVVYSEIQTPTTNANGLISIAIGGETGFDDIDWATGPYFIKTETDPAGGTNYTISGTSQIMSVPYALHAKTAEHLTGTIMETDPVFVASPANTITGTDITNWNDKLTEVDSSATDELQVLSIRNDTIYLSNGGFVDLPAEYDGTWASLTGKPDFAAVATSGNYNDLSDLPNIPVSTSQLTNDAGFLTKEADSSVTNEIQVLRISSDTIYLSNGGFVKLPASNAWTLSGNAGTGNANFIGTTDNMPLRFLVNGQRSGRIDATSGVFLGYQAGMNTTATENTGVGFQALQNNAGSYGNTAFGYLVLKNNSGNGRNTAVGSFAMVTNSTGEWNTALGSSSLQTNAGGTHNTAVGGMALNGNISGNGNSVVGYGAMQSHKSGLLNTAIGMYSMANSSTGEYNTAIGYQSGHNVGTGSFNVFLGNKAGFNETGSNKLYIANSELDPPLIYGDFSTGNVGLGTTTPATKLDVNGDVTVRGSFYAPGTVVQTIVRTSEVTSSLNTVTFTEPNADYRISIVPKFANSIFLIEYSFSVNSFMQSNTIFHIQLVRDIGATETPIGIGPGNALRDRTTYVGRPANGYDTNDQQTIYLVAKDNGLTPGTPYTYGFKYRREGGGSGTCYFNYSNVNSVDIGFSGVMIMKITEIAQ